ncbi:MAG TPA: ABC transporter substrate-binding protein, partial [Clostridium sp.]|nr:ABC transporter substrate-binding protein [Clostridium sp.]
MASLMAMSVMTGCQSGQKTEQVTASGETAKTDESKTEAPKAGNGEPVVLRMWGGVPAEAGPQ